VSVNAPDNASGSPINNKNAAMIPAKTRNPRRVSLVLAEDELLIPVILDKSSTDQFCLMFPGTHV
jgi:hypothetical protein